MSSQSARLAGPLHAANRTDGNLREAGAALRFLIDHGASPAIAAAVGKPLPPIKWKPLPRYADRDSLASLCIEDPYAVDDD